MTESADHKTKINTIIKYYENGDLTDLEVLSKVLNIIPPDESKRSYWTALPVWLKNDIISYFNAGCEAAPPFLNRTKDEIDAEFDLKQWLISLGCVSKE